MNKVVLIGRLTNDPEIRFAPSTGTAITRFILAVDRRYKTEGQPEADFIPIVVFGKTAESTANYMRKGRLIGISGRIQTRNYEAKDGTKRYVTEVVADEVQFLDWGSKKENNESVNKTSDEDLTPVDDEDIPF